MYYKGLATRDKKFTVIRETVVWSSIGNKEFRNHANKNQWRKRDQKLRNNQEEIKNSRNNQEVIQRSKNNLKGSVTLCLVRECLVRECLVHYA